MKRLFSKYYKYLLAGYFGICAVAVWRWAYYEMAKQELVNYMSSTYSYDDYISVKRGLYSGCEGQILALNNPQYVVYFTECKGHNRFHAVVNADEFDDKALSFMEKF